MRCRIIFCLLFLFASGAAVADYWTWTHAFLFAYKTTTNGLGFVTLDDPSAGRLDPALGDYNQQNTIQYSQGDSSPAQTFLSIAGTDGTLIRPDGFSFNNDISGWLAGPEHALLFTVAENYRNVLAGGYYSESTDGYTITTTTVVDGSGLDTGYYQQVLGRVIPNPDPNGPPYVQTTIPNPLGSQYTSNDNVRVINATGREVVVKVGENQDWAINTLGIVDLS